MDLKNQESRKLLIKQFKEDGKERDKQSQMEYDIFSGRIENYVNEELKEKYGEQTFKSMTKINTVNMAKRVASQEASIYKENPDRSFGIEDKTVRDNLETMYEKIQVTPKLLRANRIMRLSMQGFIYIALKDGWPELRILKKHNVKRLEFPTLGEVWGIPNYRYTTSNMSEEEKAKNERWTIWSKDYNFVCNAEGELTSENADINDISNPLKEVMIVEFSTEKDEDFWINENSGLATFTIQLNAALSDLLHVMKMQGFSTFTVSGHKEVLAQMQANIQQLGTNTVVYLPIHTVKVGNEVKDVPTVASYVSPTPDLNGSIEVISTLLSAFLTAKGVDPKTISLSGEGEKFSSGWERLLALISKFDSSKEDMPVFTAVEYQIFKKIKVLVETYKGSKEKVLADDFLELVKGIESAELSLDYKKPELVETRKELFDRLISEIKEGFRTKVSALAEYYNITETEAKKRLEEIEAEKVTPTDEEKEIIDTEVDDPALDEDEEEEVE